MSFVLEALKKQEAAADPEAAASLARAATRERRQRRWALGFAVAMTVNVALLTWLVGGPWLARLGLDDGPAAIPTPAPAAGAASEPAAATEPPAVAAAAATPDSALAAPDSAAAGNAAPGIAAAAPTPAAVAAGGAAQAADRAPAAPPPATTGPVRIPLGELPSAARARFPGIVFSTHIYAEDADLRAIVANGQRLREGERVRGLRIREITETGVVLAFEDYLVEVPIVTDWDTLP